MKSSRKFLFDTCFDGQRPATAQPAPKAKQPEPEPTFSKADLEAARAEGFAAGHEQGRQEAQVAGEQAATQALSTIGSALQALLARQEETLSAHERNALSAGATIVRKLFPRLAASEAMPEIEQVIDDCLKRLRTEPRLVIRVADPLLDRLRERLDALVQHAGFEGKIVLLTDETLANDSVRVEWADGGAERDSDKIWREIDGVLERALGDARPGGQASSAAPHSSIAPHHGEPQSPAAPSTTKTAAAEATTGGKLGLSHPA
jgi:flagellar assembly protein FliH